MMGAQFASLTDALVKDTFGTQRPSTNNTA